MFKAAAAITSVRTVTLTPFRKLVTVHGQKPVSAMNRSTVMPCRAISPRIKSFRYSLVSSVRFILFILQELCKRSSVLSYAI